MDPVDSQTWNVCCIFVSNIFVSITCDLCHFTVTQFPRNDCPGPSQSLARFYVDQKCRKRRMRFELGGERGDVGKVEMKRVDLPGAVHLTTPAPSPSATTTHHFNFQLLTVFTSFSRKKTAEDI